MSGLGSRVITSYSIHYTKLYDTRAPYNSNTVYGGACDANALYWTDIDILPTCDASNEQWIDKGAFYCDFATNQIFGIGTFTNTMIQYRADDAVSYNFV